MKNDGSSRRWTSRDMCGSPSSDICLLTLGVLRCVTRSWIFDYLEEATAMSRENHRKFFNVFMIYGSTFLCFNHVILPFHSSIISDQQKLFKMAAINCFIASVDETHVLILN